MKKLRPSALKRRLFPMPPSNENRIANEAMRGMRPDAHRFIRPDWRRFVRPGCEGEAPFDFYECFERKYSPDQPRVPAGNSDGGQWTSEGGGGQEANRKPVSAPNGTNASTRDSTRIAQYDTGKLIGQAVIHNGIGRMCFYRFSFGIVMVPGATSLGCSLTLPSAGAVHGTLVGNDNR